MVASDENSVRPGSDEAARSIVCDLMDWRLAFIPAKQASVPACVRLPSPLKRDQVCEADGFIIVNIHTLPTSYIGCGEGFFHAVAKLSSNTLDLPDGGSASFADDAPSARTLIGS